MSKLWLGLGIDNGLDYKQSLEMVLQIFLAAIRVRLGNVFFSVLGWSHWWTVSLEARAG